MADPSTQEAMEAIFAQHMDAELAGDLDQTLATMTADPHLVNVPTMVGGAGPEGVRDFYANRLIGQFFPPDVEFTTGLLDPTGLPVAGREAAGKVLDPTIRWPHFA